MPENRRYEETREYPVPPRRIWDILSNTDRLNRAISLPHVEYGPPADGPQGRYRTAAARYWGLIPMRWKEFPFDWVRDRRYSVQRDFEIGPMERFLGGVELEPSPAGTRVKVFCELKPRHWLGALIAPSEAHKGIRATFEYCEGRLKDPESASASPPRPAGAFTPASEEALDRAMGALLAGGADPTLAERLRRHLIEAGDEEVLRMRPYALAEAWGVDRGAVLRLFLQATRAGVLDLAWVLICPNCRVPKGGSRSLSGVSSRFHCDLCAIEYNAEFDRYVELRFSVHPTLREARDLTYCIGGPMNSPHALVQQRLDPGAAQEVPVRLDAEPVRVRVVGPNHRAEIEPSDVPSGPVEVLFGADGLPDATIRAPRGEAVLRLKNTSARPILTVVEKTPWDPLGVSAAEVTALQEFRDLFGSEVLAPGQELGVRSVTLFFTDLKDSTSLYEAVGDAPAYGRVRRHFDYLIGIVKDNRGALVKTIGDAVMAVFIRPTDAFRAALETQKRVGEFNRGHRIDPPLVIKIGLHEGPAIVLNANDRLDYFGRTVNISARVQGESKGGDVVLTETLFNDPAIQAVASGYVFEARPFEAHLKGIEGTFRLVRLVF